MQDKEFDELFRVQLENLEVEPRKGLWDNIAAEVVIARKDRSALPFISIAASVLVLIGAGLFFIPRLNPDNTKPATHLAAQPAGKPKTNAALPVAGGIMVVAPHAATIAAVRLPVKARSHKQNINKQNSSLPVAATDAEPQQQIAQVIPHNDAILAAVKPDAPAVITPPITAEVKNSQIAALSLQAVPAKTIAAVQPKKRRIRSFGDLINVVVSKVDKRKDKLIEFSNKDDDESLVTGINLGIIRVKKEEVVATNK